MSEVYSVSHKYEDVGSSTQKFEHIPYHPNAIDIPEMSFRRLHSANTCLRPWTSCVHNFKESPEVRPVIVKLKAEIVIVECLLCGGKHTSHSRLTRFSVLGAWP